MKTKRTNSNRRNRRLRKSFVESIKKELSKRRLMNEEVEKTSSEQNQMLEEDKNGIVLFTLSSHFSSNGKPVVRNVESLLSYAKRFHDMCFAEIEKVKRSGKEELRKKIEELKSSNGKNPYKSLKNIAIQSNKCEWDIQLNLCYGARMNHLNGILKLKNDPIYASCFEAKEDFIKIIELFNDVQKELGLEQLVRETSKVVLSIENCVQVPVAKKTREMAQMYADKSKDTKDQERKRRALGSLKSECRRRTLKSSMDYRHVVEKRGPCDYRDMKNEGARQWLTGALIGLGLATGSLASTAEAKGFSAEDAMETVKDSVVDIGYRQNLKMDVVASIMRYHDAPPGTIEMYGRTKMLSFSFKGEDDGKLVYEATTDDANEAKGRTYTIEKGRKIAEESEGIDKNLMEKGIIKLEIDIGGGNSIKNPHDEVDSKNNNDSQKERNGKELEGKKIVKIIKMDDLRKYTGSGEDAEKGLKRLMKEKFGEDVEIDRISLAAGQRIKAEMSVK